MVPKERLRQLVSVWAVGPDHPLKAPVLQAAAALIDDKRLDWKVSVELMRLIGSYSGQRAALAIAYFASDCESTEGDKALDETQMLMREQWEANGF
jgi:hypothetical protein